MGQIKNYRKLNNEEVKFTVYDEAWLNTYGGWVGLTEMGSRYVLIIKTQFANIKELYDTKKEGRDAAVDWMKVNPRG